MGMMYRKNILRLLIKLLKQMVNYIIQMKLNQKNIHHGFLKFLGIQLLLMEKYGQK